MLREDNIIMCFVNIKKQVSLIFLMFKRRKPSELVKKNIEIILGYPLYVFSFLIPRKKNKWVIGSHIGFAGNSKYFFIHTVTKENKNTLFWITASRKDVKHIRSMGLPAYYKWSVKGIFHSLTANIYIFSSHLTDINFWTSGGAKRVNFWHGVGIKKIEFELSRGSGKKIYDEKNIISRIYLPQLFKRPHFFLVTSPLMKEHFKRCFRISDKECFECGYPRNEILSWNKGKLEEFILKYEPESSYSLVDRLKKSNASYLYMPTWRETRTDFISSAGFDFNMLNSVLEKRNELFLLKLHPATNLNLEQLKDLTNIIIVDKNIDIYPILPFTTILITDYSSIYYDYLLIKNNDIVLFPFDYEDYIMNSRDLAFSYDEYTVGKKVCSFSDLLELIYDDQKNLKFDEHDKILRLFWNNHYENSSSIIYEKLEQLN